MHLDRAMGSKFNLAEPTGIDGAISRIGMAGINTITIHVLANQALNGAHHRKGLSLVWLWRHCYTTALLAQALAVELNYRAVEEAYIAGLLHDIGKLALCARTPTACDPLLADPTHANPLLEAEARVVGTGHDRIGAQLIRGHTAAWFAADAARYHTASVSQVQNALPLVQIIWAANRLDAEWYPSSEACQAASELLNLDAQRLGFISKNALEKATAAADELGVPFEFTKTAQTEGSGASPFSHEISGSIILSSVYGQLLTATDTNAILRTLRQCLSALMGINTLILFDYEPHGDCLVANYTSGGCLSRIADRLCVPISASDSLPVTCHLSAEPVDSFSWAGSGELTIIDYQLLAFMQTDGMVGLPVRSGITVSSGCLLLGIDANDWPRVRQQLYVLKAIAAAAADALSTEKQGQNPRSKRIADRFTSTMD